MTRFATWFALGWGLACSRPDPPHEATELASSESDDSADADDDEGSDASSSGDGDGDGDGDEDEDDDDDDDTDDDNDDTGTDGETGDETGDETSDGDPDTHPWSVDPPGGLDPSEVPQFVALGFDDNFGLEGSQATGGVGWIVDELTAGTNPAGTGQTATFDGSAAAVTFFHTSLYIDPDHDTRGRNLAAWRAAYEAGHEAANHTVLHKNGGEIDAGSDPCCTAKHLDVDGWLAELDGCSGDLSHPTAGIGADASEVKGVRSPFLSYNDALFEAMPGAGLTYDSSISSCFLTTDDGSTCPWPYSLHDGSPDADNLSDRFGGPPVSGHPDLWEMPPTGLIVPADDLAETYGFAPGLRDRVPFDMSFPDTYSEESQITGMDYTLLIAAELEPTEMTAILSYNLDLHLEGNRAPLIFVGHGNIYATSSGSSAIAARQQALQAFVDYALAKDAVRIRPYRDIIEWIRDPVPLAAAAR